MISEIISSVCAGSYTAYMHVIWLMNMIIGSVLQVVPHIPYILAYILTLLFISSIPSCIFYIINKSNNCGVISNNTKKNE